MEIDLLTSGLQHTHGHTSLVFLKALHGREIDFLQLTTLFTLVCDE